MDTSYYRKVYLYGKDILKFPKVKEEKKYIQHGNVSVYQHTLLVAIGCLKFAESTKMKVDKKALVRGALLHDYFLYDWHKKDESHKLHGFTHAKKAFINASNDFKLNDIEKNMIICHMFPLNLRIPKYRESAILCLIDKACAINEIFR